MSYTYIHGTNSLALSLLPKTGFALASPYYLINKYQLAPFGGEVVQSRYVPLNRDYVAFGALETIPIGFSDAYTLKLIVENYTSGEMLCREKLIENIHEEIAGFKAGGFSRLNMVLIYLARAKQTGISTEDIVTIEEIKALNRDIDAMIQYFHLLLLLGTHINVAEQSLVDNFKPQNAALWSAFIEQFTYSNIINKITANKINVEHLYHHRAELSEEALQPLIDMLALSGGHCFSVNKDIKLASDLELEWRGKMRCKDKDFYALSMNASTALATFLKEMMQGLMTAKYFQELHINIIAFLNALKEKRSNLNMLFEMPAQSILSEEDNAFTAAPFPLIFIADNSKKMLLHDERKAEYRAYEPLVVGKDIKTIATRTEENKHVVSEFLVKNGLTSVNVITLDKLKERMISNIAAEFLLVFREQYPHKFKNTNSSGLKKMYKIVNSNQSPYQQLKNMIAIARAKTTPGFSFWYSNSHILGKGRHKNVMHLYKELSRLTLDVDDMSDVLLGLQKITVMINSLSFIHGSIEKSSDNASVRLSS